MFFEMDLDSTINALWAVAAVAVAVALAVVCNAAGPGGDGEL